MDPEQEQMTGQEAEADKMDDEMPIETPVEESAKMEGEETPEEETPAEKAEGEMEGEDSGEGPMSEEMRGYMRETVMAVLKEVGLVREEGEETPYAAAAEVTDLRKALGKLAPATRLEKVAGDVTKAFGDIAKVAEAADELADRVERLEKLPQGTGPVLRELGSLGGQAIEGQTETVLKGLLADATDPAMREMIGHKLAQLTIKSTYNKAA